MSTFGQLKTSTDSWLARDDLATGSDIDQITLNTEAQIARDIRTVAQERNTTLTANARQTIAPSDFLEARYLAIDSLAVPGEALGDEKSPEKLSG